MINKFTKVNICLTGTKKNLYQRIMIFLVIIMIPVSGWLTFKTEIFHLACSTVFGPRINLTKSPTKITQIGINIPWIAYGQDFGLSPWSWRGVSKDKIKAHRLFSTLKKSKIDLVVWFLLADGRSAPKWKENGFPFSLDNYFWQDYDEAIRLARDNKIAILWVILDYKMFLPQKRIPLDSAKKENDKVSIFGHADIIEEKSKREAFLTNIIFPIVYRYRYERNIAGWIIVNEPEHAVKEGHVSDSAMTIFLTEAAKIIHSTTQSQPITIAHADIESMIT